MKKIVIALLFILPVFLEAQITISIQQPAGGLINHDQLWNLLLVNMKEDLNDVTIRMSLQDKSSGEIVLAAHSRPFSILKGIRKISMPDVQPVQYDLMSAAGSAAYLTPGNYIACYEIINTPKDFSPVVRECIAFNVEPLSPPLLASPVDHAIIPTPYPQFSWMPPTPVQIFHAIKYDITVVELLEGQTAVEAITVNPPVYSNTHLNQLVDVYAGSAGKLKEDRTYAWQITADDGKNYKAHTEVWQFKIAKDSVENIISIAPFVKLENLPDQVSIAHQGFLKLEILNQISDTSGVIVVRNAKKASAPENEFVFRVSLQHGQNLILYDMSKHKRLDNKELYEVEYTNSLKQSVFMRFVPIYYR